MYKKSLQSWKKHLDFTIIDLIVIAISYMLAVFIRFGFHLSFFQRDYALQNCVILLLIYFLVAMFTNSYKNILRRDRYQEARSVIVQIIFTFAIFVVYLYLSKQMFSRAITIESALIGAVLIYGSRIVWKRIIRLHMLENENLPHLLIIAEEKTIEQCLQVINRRRYNDFYVSGVIVTDRDMTGLKIEHRPVVCCASKIREYALSSVVDEVFISMSDDKEKRKLVDFFLELGVTVHVSLTGDDAHLPNRVIERLGGHYVLTTSNNTAAGWKLLIKRMIDIIGGLIGLLVTGILCIFIAPAIRKQDPGPIFFTQERIGKNGRKFKIYKFRSMYLDAEQRKKDLMEKNQMEGLMFKMDDDPRILPGIGHKIRDLSLDEFPQFLNVLKGDMSLVGTRPPTVDEFEKYEAHHKMRLSFKPGITGLWQISGRSNIKDFEEIVKLDNAYIKNWNLRLDIKILAKTVKVVMHKEGSM